MKLKCYRCGQEKEAKRENFYPDKRMSHGFRNSPCRPCTNKDFRERGYASYPRYKKAGLCTSCGGPRVGTETTQCIDCWFKKVARRSRIEIPWTVLEEKYRKQNASCYYTGRVLIPGKNASLDHKKPVGRFPESVSDPENLVWCDMSINAMKHSMTEEEFYAVIQEIVQARDLVGS